VAQPATSASFSRSGRFLGESKKGGEKHTIRRIITMLTVAAMLVLASPASAQGGCKEFGNAVAGFTQEFNPSDRLLAVWPR
jgi:hypothetical protein